jgi:hypothetical protein
MKQESTLNFRDRFMLVGKPTGRQRVFKGFDDWSDEMALRKPLGF